MILLINKAMKKKILIISLLFSTTAVLAQVTTPLSNEVSREGQGVSLQSSYTLDQCKQLANENNYTSRSARNAIEQSQQQQREAFTKYFPQISAQGVAFQAHKPLLELDLPVQVSQMVGVPTNISVLKKALMGSVSAVQPVFMGGMIVNSNRLAKVGLEASRIKEESSADDVDMQTEKFFWNVISQKEKMKTLNALNEQLTQLEHDVDAMVRAGIITRNDLLLVQLKHNEIEKQIVRLSSGMKVSKELLAQYIGVQQDGFDVTAEVPSEVPPFDASLMRDHQSAVTSTTGYRLLEKNVESQRLQHLLKKGANLPKVGVGAAYTYHDISGAGDGSSASMFATVSVPLSGWWGGSYAAKKQKLAYEDAKQQLEDSQQKLIINMDNAWSELDTSYRSLVIARKGIEQSEENLRLNQSYYKAGTTRLTDLLDAQASYQKTHDDYVDAYIDYQLNVLKYKQATGQ